MHKSANGFNWGVRRAPKAERSCHGNDVTPGGFRYGQ